ncbi:hypothetical protein [Streptomyces sp. SLBN-31]|nr:hypothetical protein [Streptomyces sp. SLBN-31]
MGRGRPRSSLREALTDLVRLDRVHRIWALYAVTHRYAVPADS